MGYILTTSVLNCITMTMPDNSPEEVVTMTIPDDVMPKLMVTTNLTLEGLSHTHTYIVLKDDKRYCLCGEPQEKRVKSEDILMYKASSEKVLENYVHDNINILWKDLFDEEVISVHQQYGEKTKPLSNTRPTRIDLFVECQSGNKYLVEIKNNLSGDETYSAIGKLLFYSIVFPEANKYVVIATSYQRKVNDLLKRWSLPIDFVLFSEDKIYLMKK